MEKTRTFEPISPEADEIDELDHLLRNPRQQPQAGNPTRPVTREQIVMDAVRTAGELPVESLIRKAENRKDPCEDTTHFVHHYYHKR